ncbi:NAD(P)/FAD-dependent oxidoreductase, partial [Streptomyces sp. SID8111]|nr:NAD(P)/FAD-dependent oxidoreductase [Streptomyces sp. SID8111]
LRALFGGRPSLPARPTVTVLRPDDPALVPGADHEAVTLSAVVPARSGGEHGQDAEALAGYAGQLIEVAERAVPGLRDRLLWHEVRTPADIAAET